MVDSSPWPEMMMTLVSGLYQRTMFGPLNNPKNQNLADLNWREMATLVPLVIWAFWIGLYPKPYFQVLEKPVAKIVERVQPGYYAGAGGRGPGAGGVRLGTH